VPISDSAAFAAAVRRGKICSSEDGTARLPLIQACEFFSRNSDSAQTIDDGAPANFMRGCALSLHRAG
jgi:hypothetical protein